MRLLFKFGFNISRMSFLSLLLIVVVLLSVIVLNDIFPLSVDIYYHLLTALGFSKAGGVVLHDFWNFAPEGRPNLYPPFISLIASFFINIGSNPIVIARVLCILVYSLFLITLWVVIRNRLGEGEAFFAVLSSILPYTFFLSLVNQLPAAFSLILLLLIFYFLENGRITTGALLLGLSFYVHLTMPWITILTLFFYGLLFNRKRIKSALSIVLLGTLIGLPWIINILINRKYFDLSRISESRVFELYPLFFLLGISGIFIAWKKRDAKKYAFILASLVSIFTIFFKYPYRVLGGEGLFILIIFSGVALNYIYQKIARKYGYGVFMPIIMAAVLIVFSPVFVIWVGADVPDEYKKVQLRIQGGVLPRMLSYYQRHIEGASLINPMETALVFDRTLPQAASFVGDNSKEDELIYSNIPYLAGLLGVISHRFISTGMFYEVVPYDKRRDPVSSAKLIVWLKGIKGKRTSIEWIQERYKLHKIYENEIVLIYKNDNPQARAIISRASISYNQAAFLFSLFLFAIFVDIKRSKSKNT